MNIHEKAVYHYGEDSQIIKCIEELSELIVQLSKYQNGKNNIAEIAEEIADSRIMLEQMEIVFNCSATVKRNIGTKLNRLEQRIKNDKWRG
jgi:hypothetical protein